MVTFRKVSRTLKFILSDPKLLKYKRESLSILNQEINK